MYETQQLFIATVLLAGEAGERKYAVHATTTSGAIEALREELGRDAFRRAAISIEACGGSVERIA